MDVSGKVLVTLESYDIVVSPVFEIEAILLGGRGVYDTIGLLEHIARNDSGNKCLCAQVVIDVVVEAGEVLSIPLETAGSNGATDFTSTCI